MTKFQKNMEQIARLARDSMNLAESEEDRQTAIEIKLAAECTLPQHNTRHPTLATRHPHHD